MSKDQDKRLTFEVALDRGTVKVLFDPRARGVVIPDFLGADMTSEVAFAYDRRAQIPGLSVVPEGIHARLLFRGTRHPTFVPWAAVTAIQENGRTVGEWAPGEERADPWAYQGCAEA